jgi:hypothetical protein
MFFRKNCQGCLVTIVQQTLNKQTYKMGARTDENGKTKHTEKWKQQS